MFKDIIRAQGALAGTGNSSGALGLTGQRALVLIGLLLMVLTGCANSQDAIPTPEPTPFRPITSDGTPGPVSSPPPTIAPAPTQPSPTPTEPSVTPTPQTPVASPEPLSLRIISPLHGSGLEVGFVRVMGTTSGTMVRINGLPAQVAENGDFHRDLSLQEGVNLLEVVASDEVGQTVAQQITVFVVAPTASLPFTILYPRDGVEISSPTIPLVGVTRPDAVVGVNDVPMDIGASGIFSTMVELEEGANLIEVVATDIEGNVRFQTVAVFYLP